MPDEEDDRELVELTKKCPECNGEGRCSKCSNGVIGAIYWEDELEEPQ